MKTKKSLSACVNTHDVRNKAKSYLPKVIFDYLDGGTEDELCLQENRSSIESIKFLPKYLVDISKRNQKTTLFNESYSSCFGVAPMGMLGILRKDADLMLAKHAAKKEIPFILSGASSTSIEAAAKANSQCWFQFYPCKSEEIESDLLKRAHDAGITKLVVTVDVPHHSKRERSIKSKWVRPYKPTLAMILDAAKRPGWTWGYLTNGLPKMETFAKYSKDPESQKEIIDLFSSQIPGIQNFPMIQRIREKWKGQLIVKGILSPEDAKRLVEYGVDGIIVSNHGGRQLDKSISAIEALPLIVEAVGDKLTVMFDSGLRRGSDVAAAMALGAKFCFIGRPYAYGISAFGIPGADKVYEILKHEIDLFLGQIGCPDLSAIDAGYIYKHQ